MRDASKSPMSGIWGKYVAAKSIASPPRRFPRLGIAHLEFVAVIALLVHWLCDRAHLGSDLRGDAARFRPTPKARLVRNGRTTSSHLWLLHCPSPPSRDFFSCRELRRFQSLIDSTWRRGKATIEL